MPELLELAARCEAAEGAGRELDMLIVQTLWPWPEYADVMDEWPDCPRHHGTIWPRFTASLDAAMTLVPEGAFYGFVMNGGGDGFDACCQFAGPDEEPPELLWYTAATPALALCAASLRARAADHA